MLQEFKKFILQGSMVDIAIGIVVGAAFGDVVSSLVRDMVMPPIGLLLGDMDFSNLVITLQAATTETPAVVIAYGKFMQTLLDFLIIAFAVFMVIKGMNRLRDDQSSTPENLTNTALLMQIRDALKDLSPKQ